MPEHAVLLGLTAEMSPSYVSVLLPEIAWNLAVCRRLAQPELTLNLTLALARTLTLTLTLTR